MTIDPLPQLFEIGRRSGNGWAALWPRDDDYHLGHHDYDLCDDDHHHALTVKLLDDQIIVNHFVGHRAQERLALQSPLSLWRAAR